MWGDSGEKKYLGIDVWGVREKNKMCGGGGSVPPEDFKWNSPKVAVL